MLQGKKHPKSGQLSPGKPLILKVKEFKNNEEINDKIESINFLTEKAEEFDKKRYQS